MSGDSDQEHARVAEEARRAAHEAKERARVDAERAKAEAMTGGMKEEELRQLGLIYGGLIGVAVVMVQPFLATSLDLSAEICIIASAVAIPLLAGLVMLNRQEAFRRRRTSSATVTVAEVVAQNAAFIGLVAGFSHISWVAGVSFLASGLVAVLVYSAGYHSLGGVRQPASDAPSHARPSESSPRDGRPAASPCSRGIGPAAVPSRERLGNIG